MLQISAMAICGGSPARHWPFACARATASIERETLAGEMQRQALVMSYVDGFWIMGVGLLVAAPLVFLLRRPPPGTVGAMH